MYKILSLALVGVLAAMIFPAAFETNSDDKLAAFYGYTVIALKDPSGTVLFENGVHNNVLSNGADFVLDQVFGDGNEPVNDAGSVDAVCINLNPRFGVNLFDAGNESTISNTLVNYNLNDGDPANADLLCQVGVFTTAASGADGIASAVSATENFVAAGTNLPDGGTVFGIAICEVTADQNDCEFPIFALVDTSDVTVNAGETLDVTYTMTLD